MIDCEFCHLTVSKSNYSKHKKTDLCKNINTVIKNNIKENDIKLTNYIHKNEKLKEENIILNNKILTLENKNLEDKVKTLQEISEQYRKIVEKAATKSTKTTVNNNNNNTYNRNNYLNYVSTEPIKFGEIQQQINNFVTTKTIMYDNDDFNNYITKNILKDENGKDKVLCTDINRKNFTYKDEKSGQMITDPELERLREKLKNTSHNTSVKKDLLDKLISKYEGTRIDPYVRFYECLQNIEYGQPFVEHVAKKTYVKNKPLEIEEVTTSPMGERAMPSVFPSVGVFPPENKERTLEIKNNKTEIHIVKDNEKSKVDDDIDIDNVNIEEIDDIEILDRIIMKYEKRMNDKNIKIEIN